MRCMDVCAGYDPNRRLDEGDSRARSSIGPLSCVGVTGVTGTVASACELPASFCQGSFEAPTDGREKGSASRDDSDTAGSAGEAASLDGDIKAAEEPPSGCTPDVFVLGDMGTAGPEGLGSDEPEAVGCGRLGADSAKEVD